MGHRADEIRVVLAVVGVDEGEGGLPDAVGDGVARELLPGPVQQGPATVAVDPEDDLANVLDDRAIARFAFAQRCDRGPSRGVGHLEPAAVAVQDQTDETGHAGHRPDPDRGCQDGRQVGARRRHLDHDRGDDADHAGDNDGDRDATAVEERQGEGDAHDRDSGHCRDRWRNRGHDEDEDEHARDKQDGRPPAVTSKRLPPTLDQQGRGHYVEHRCGR